MRNLADFALKVIGPVLRPVLSDSPISLSGAAPRQHAEVHKDRAMGPMKSTTYGWTNRAV
jgi:hypothetical protein